MEWISVKDRLPGTKQGCCLVCKKDYTPAVAYWIEAEGCYYFCIGSDTKQTWNPDYWMPFPDQPNCSNKEEIK